MAEGIIWLKIIAFVLVPVSFFFAISWIVKNYKKKNDNLGIIQRSDNITHLKQDPISANQENTSNIVGHDPVGGLNGQMELERRRFAGSKL